jgi:hypothetical protein
MPGAVVQREGSAFAGALGYSLGQWIEKELNHFGVYTRHAEAEQFTAVRADRAKPSCRT